MSAHAGDDVQARLARLGRLRRDGGALRDYRAPRWNAPLIMEQSVPGERGVLVPLVEDEVRSEVGDPLQYVPAAMRRLWPLISLGRQSFFGGRAVNVTFGNSRRRTTPPSVEKYEYSSPSIRIGRIAASALSAIMPGLS